MTREHVEGMSYRKIDFEVARLLGWVELDATYNTGKPPGHDGFSKVIPRYTETMAAAYPVLRAVPKHLRRHYMIRLREITSCSFESVLWDVPPVAICKAFLILSIDWPSEMRR